MNLKPLLEVALRAAEEASRVILEVYQSGDFQAETKGDQSPLTIADKKAHLTITSILQPSNLPILSEEGKSIPYEMRKNWDYFWMVDPLDGTKEFLKRNGDFTVNIAIIHNQRPILGVVAVPVTGDVYFGARGMGAFLRRDNRDQLLSPRKKVDLAAPGLRVVASRSHLNEETQLFINKLIIPELVSRGSSLKFMLLAEGLADVYPRFAPTMEWDTAAAHAIVNELHTPVLEQDRSRQLHYNKESLLNPSFICYP